MSRNFELLRRAGKAEVLFYRPGGDRLSDTGGRTQSDREIAAGKIAKAEKDGALRRGPDLSQSTQEEAAKLVQRVFVFSNSHAARMVVFSSADERSGSGEICFRAGEVLAAQRSGSVCLVDANLRAPSLHQVLGVAKSPGLTDATVTPGPIRDFGVQVAGRNLWIVPPGSPEAAAHGLFASGPLRLRIDELRKEFDYVLIDAPPVSSCGDAVLLGQMADGVILVVEANSTRREAAWLAKETFEGAEIRLLGGVLNNRTFPIPEALYRKL
jgi:Mrp family chromosome partitioning ATPase